MNAHLMYRDRDFDPQEEWPANEPALTQDLELNVLLNAMAQGDEFLFKVAKQALLSGLPAGTETILYRQAILKDCLRNEALIRKLYDIAIEGVESKRKGWFGLIASYPRGILHGAVELLQLLVESLRKLKRVADEDAHYFESRGFVSFFALLRAELDEDYLALVDSHLESLKFRKGVLLSAELGKGNAGANYMLRKSKRKEAGWIERLFTRGPVSYTFQIADRDEAGARALSDLQDRGLNIVANATAQSADHIMGFFVMLRTELGFYLGCLNLHRKLLQKHAAVSFPVPAPAGARRHSCLGLRDVCLVLTLDRNVIGNDMDGDGRNLFVITGANQGGKSTFLRGIGLAQLMMQCGMFVTADRFSADICRGLHTHYKREEDASMKSGKFDEELSRMSAIADALTPDSLLLFNESFAATNEREGSEIAKQIVHALRETEVKIFFVTHLYQFARDLWEEKRSDALFLRAERRGDGERTFKLLPGEPLQTSFGPDLYERIFHKTGTGFDQPVCDGGSLDPAREEATSGGTIQ